MRLAWWGASENMRAAAVTLTTYLCFALNDAILKLIMLDFPQLTAVFVRGLMVVPLIAAVSLGRGELLRPIGSVAEWRLILSRCMCDLGTTLSFLAAIHAGPMADVAVILGAQPLCVMLGAALILGEGIDRFSWALGIFGLVGVGITSQPSPRSGLSPHVLLALLCVIFGVGRDLLARQISAAVPATQIAAMSALVITCTAGVGSVLDHRTRSPTVHEVALLALASLLIALALIGSVVQMRLGEVGFVQPLRYSFIVYATILGIVMFDHWPDALTLVGATLIIATGVVSLWRERRRSNLTEQPMAACRKGGWLGTVENALEPEIQHAPAGGSKPELNPDGTAKPQDSAARLARLARKAESARLARLHRKQLSRPRLKQSEPHTQAHLATPQIILQKEEDALLAEEAPAALTTQCGRSRPTAALEEQDAVL